MQYIHDTNKTKSNYMGVVFLLIIPCELIKCFSKSLAFFFLCLFPNVILGVERCGSDAGDNSL